MKNCKTKQNISRLTKKVDCQNKLQFLLLSDLTIDLHNKRWQYLPILFINIKLNETKLIHLTSISFFWVVLFLSQFKLNLYNHYFFYLCFIEFLTISSSSYGRKFPDDEWTSPLHDDLTITPRASGPPSGFRRAKSRLDGTQVRDTPTRNNKMLKLRSEEEGSGKMFWVSRQIVSLEQYDRNKMHMLSGLLSISVQSSEDGV